MPYQNLHALVWFAVFCAISIGCIWVAWVQVHRPTVHASFTTLRAKGAFLVTAAYDGARRRVGDVTLISEAGQLCKVLSPWPRNATISISTIPAGRTVDDAVVMAPVGVGAFGWFEFATESGSTYLVAAVHSDVKRWV
jgi:hypothetical protein